jgi:hypothetical protein
MSASAELANRLRAEGWNDAIHTCIKLICPEPHKEEERTCEEIAEQLRQLIKPILVELKDDDGIKHLFKLESTGSIT